MFSCWLPKCETGLPRRDGWVTTPWTRQADWTMVTTVIIWLTIIIINIGYTLVSLIAEAGESGLVWTDPEVTTEYVSWPLISTFCPRALNWPSQASLHNIFITTFIHQVDPTICGHKGHFTTSCAFTFSYCVNQFIAGEACIGHGLGTDFIP